MIQKRIKDRNIEIGPVSDLSELSFSCLMKKEAKQSEYTIFSLETIYFTTLL